MSGLSNSMPYPNGSSNSSVGLGDPSSSMKEWQDGLRALFPNVNISMGNGGVAANNGGNSSNSALNSRLSAFPPGLSGLANGHQQPQPHHHQPQQQQHHLQHHLHSQGPLPMGQPSVHSLGVNKGWRSSISDWTSLDPAIVSGGQITDSRSDSPPHWLRSLEQLTETTNSPAVGHPPLANSSSNLFGLANSTHYNLPSLASRGGGSSNSSSSSNTPGPLDAGGLNSMGSFWPPSVSHTTPSMPPPGFSHIRPKAAATAEGHKLDSKSFSFIQPF